MTDKIIQLIEAEPMMLSYKMLLLVIMCDAADENGRVSLSKLAERFKAFFAERAAIGKVPENPEPFKAQPILARSAEEWERVIRDEPVRRMHPGSILEEENAVAWARDIRQNWSPEVRDRIRATAWDRLTAYYDRRVPGGF